MEAGPEDLAGIVEQTYRDLSQKMKVPGFRKGKVPRKVIDSHLGAGYVRAEAVRNGLPTLYVMGVIESGINPVCDPEINLIEAGEDGTVVFEAKVDVRPEVEVSGYRGLELEAPDTEVNDEDVDEALDEARDRFATLEVVESRPAEKGDYVMFDFKVFCDGVPLEGKAGTDRMLEIGAEDFLPGYDEQLLGARKGDIIDVVIDFPADYGEPSLAGKPATFRTIVKEIKRKVLPPVDDDLAKEVSSFDTLEEFKADLRERINTIKKSAGERQLREQAVQKVVEETEIDLPESMVERQVNAEIEELSGELAQRDITLDDYLSALKGTRQELEKAIREKVTRGMKAELTLDAIATAENIEISDEDAEEYVRETARTMGGDPDKALSEARKHDRIDSVKANMRLSRAIDLVVESAVIKGEGPPEGVLLEPPAEGGAAAGADETGVESGSAPEAAGQAEPAGEAPAVGEAAAEAAGEGAAGTREKPEEQ